MLAIGKVREAAMAASKQLVKIISFFTVFLTGYVMLVYGQQGGTAVFPAQAGGSDFLTVQPSSPELEIPYEPFQHLQPGVTVSSPGYKDSPVESTDPEEAFQKLIWQLVRLKAGAYARGELEEEARLARIHPGRKMLEEGKDPYELVPPARAAENGTGILPDGAVYFREVPENKGSGKKSESSDSRKEQAVETKDMNKDSQSAKKGNQTVSSLKMLALAALGTEAGETEGEGVTTINPFYSQSNLQLVMDELYRHVTELGYLPGDWESKIRSFQYPDQETGIIYRADINSARTYYSRNYLSKPVMPSGAECWICPQNIGDANHPVNQFLRVYFLRLNGRIFFLQPPPFPYMRLHFVLVEAVHTKMHVDLNNLKNALAFLNLAPDYTVCMNADIKGAGGSIQNHHHYQIFYEFRPPVTLAPAKNGYERALKHEKVDLLNYPMTVFRITSSDGKSLVIRAALLIEAWKQKERKRNTVNYVFRKEGEQYKVWIILRDAELKPSTEFLGYKPEDVGFIDAAGHLLLSDQATPEAEQDLESADKMLPVIKKGLASINPVNPMDESTLLELISAMSGVERE